LIFGEMLELQPSVMSGVEQISRFLEGFKIFIQTDLPRRAVARLRFSAGPMT